MGHQIGGGEWGSNPPATVRQRHGFEDREDHRIPVTSALDILLSSNDWAFKRILEQTTLRILD